jgi:hypothetical protein
MRARIQAIVGTAIDNTINQGLLDGCKDLQHKHNSDFKQELNPEISDYESTGFRRLQKIIKNGIDLRDASDSARPLQYRMWESAGKFHVQSDEAFSFPMEYYKYFADIGDDAPSDTDFVAFLNKTHEAIEYFALARCYERLQNFDVARYYQNDDPRFPLGKFELKYKELKKEDTEIALANADLQMGYPG